MARISSAYDYYMTTYANQEVSRYDSHKKSDLRKVYNKMIKTNKESPLYKIKNIDQATHFAIDIKEQAKSIQNVVASLSDRYGSFADSFQKKVAVSSDEDKVGVRYIGDGAEDSRTDEFQVSVQDIATPQVNRGNFLKDKDQSFKPDSYSFDLNTGSSAYEFQYTVNPGDTNRDVLSKLASLVNKSSLGIHAEIVNNGHGSSALNLVSAQTGLADGEETLFTLAPDGSYGSQEAMELLGIDRIAQQAHNSDFTLNGEPYHSLSNTFTINNVFELTLKQPTTKDTTIGFKANTDAIVDNIQTLIDVYNKMIRTGEDYSEADGNKLLSDMASVALGSKSTLEDIGLMVSDNGSISIDRDNLRDAVEPQHADETFATLSRFRDALGNKADNASINPMNYVSKVIVAYKNPGHNFNTPYVSSIYSGMILDDYA